MNNTANYQTQLTTELEMANAYGWELFSEFVATEDDYEANRLERLVQDAVEYIKQLKEAVEYGTVMTLRFAENNK